jgi:hypothetical protein
MNSKLHDIYSSPGYYIAPILQALVCILSIYGLYCLHVRKRIKSRVIRIFLTISLVWSILSQCFVFYHYNYDYTEPLMNVGWIMVNGTICSLIITDIMILKCFRSLNMKITDDLIRVMIGGVSLFYLACHSIAILQLLSIPVPHGRSFQRLLGSIFPLFCVLYDNLQVGYLTYLVYSSKTTKKSDRRVEESLKKTVNLNIMVCGLDWLSAILFLAEQSLQSNSMSFILQQVTTSVVGIHIVLVIFIFNRLKDLTFVGTKATVKKLLVKREEPTLQNAGTRESIILPDTEIL